MKILITGARGFIGKNLASALNNIKDGKDRTHPELNIEEIFLFDVDSSLEDLDAYCKQADFVFHLAGVNRPKDEKEFMKVNYDFSKTLLETLKKHENKCPVMLSSSIQATLLGRFEGSKYGQSKREAEDLFLAYEKETGAKALVYRLPGLFGKWGRPHYNSVVATFCHQMANDEPLTIHDASQKLSLVYIDDFIQELLGALAGKESRCEFSGLDPIENPNGRYCYVKQIHDTTVGDIASALRLFHDFPATLMLPRLENGSFLKKLFSTYLSYLPKQKMAYPLHSKSDERGSFTELLKSQGQGQVSVNITKPGKVKGEHWHQSKAEIFIVVAGKGIIRERKIDDGTILEFPVSGDDPHAVIMLPGYTHNIENLSDTEDLVTIMWANETFDESHPDTYRLSVEKGL